MIEQLAHLLPNPLGWHIAKVEFIMFASRYLVLAALFFSLASFRLGRPNRARPTLRPAQLRREIGRSLISVAIFAAVTLGLVGCRLIDHSRLYLHIADYGWPWFWLSIPVMLALHDLFFYALHRAMHLPLLYRHVHEVHHRSVFPTAWAAYSFHPWEALFEALIVVAILFVIPSHPLAFILFQTLSTLYNAYGHSGREFYPPGWSGHALGRWVNSSTTHSLHHAAGRGNYGLYSLVWDRLFGSFLDEPRKSA